MLERIEQLMAGLREVSDNIAHDLKTPLNRLRNRAEAALRDSSRASRAYREGLERTIEEADELIKTFNALLLIARLEAGAVEASGETFDLAVAVARRRRALRAGGRGGGAGDSIRGGRRRRHRRAPTASWSARRSPISSTTPSSTAAPAAAAPRRRRRDASAIDGDLS